MTNVVVLTGHLANDPMELKQMQTGTKYVRARLRTTRNYYVEGELRAKSDWHTVYAYRETAEQMALRSAPGDLVAVRGELTSREVKDAQNPNSKEREHFVRVYEYDNLTRSVHPQAVPTQQAAPVQQQPAPVQQQPAPVQQQPAPVQQGPQPVQQQPQPVQQLAPAHQHGAQPVQEQAPAPALQPAAGLQNGAAPAPAGAIVDDDLPF